MRRSRVGKCRYRVPMPTRRAAHLVERGAHAVLTESARRRRRAGAGGCAMRRCEAEADLRIFGGTLQIVAEGDDDGRHDHHHHQQQQGRADLRAATAGAGRSPTASDWPTWPPAADGVLATINRRGFPHLTTVIYAWDPAHKGVRVSTRADRVKAKNLARNEHAASFVEGPDVWSFVVAEGAAEISPVSIEPGDATGRELLGSSRRPTKRRKPPSSPSRSPSSGSSSASASTASTATSSRSPQPADRRGAAAAVVTLRGWPSPRSVTGSGERSWPAEAPCVVVPSRRSR